MKIVVDARFIGKSGIGTYIENVVSHLLNSHSEHEYLFITSKSGFIKERENVKVMICDVEPFSLKELFSFPLKEINNYDVFYSPYINLPLGLKIPVFSTIHDVLFLDVKGLVSFTGKIVRKIFLWYAVKRSKAVFTVSEFSKKRIEHYFGTKKKIVVTYCGLPQKVSNVGSDVAEKQDYFVFVGNVKPHKGLHVLVKAFNDAKKNGLTSKLYIVGENKNFRTTDSSFNEMISSNKDIEFTGFISDERLVELVRKAKALVLPSFYEGFGLPPLEALFSGTNALISDIEVFQEIYEKLPVTFFEVGNSEQLQKCLSDVDGNFENLEQVQSFIKRKYSFEQVANIIDKTIKEGC